MYPFRSDKLVYAIFYTFCGYAVDPDVNGALFIYSTIAFFSFNKCKHTKSKFISLFILSARNAKKKRETKKQQQKLFLLRTSTDTNEHEHTFYAI